MQDRLIIGAGTTGSGTGFWLAIEAIREHGPSWSVLPPLLMGISSLVMAGIALRRSQREDLAAASEELRRQEMHEARMERFFRHPINGPPCGSAPPLAPRSADPH